MADSCFTTTIGLLSGTLIGAGIVALCYTNPQMGDYIRWCVPTGLAGGLLGFAFAFDKATLVIFTILEFIEIVFCIF